jgi:Holliday junction resolvase RusA-like endonuclease
MRIKFTLPGKPRGKARPLVSARIAGYGEKARAIANVRAQPDDEIAEAEIARLYRVAALAEIKAMGLGRGARIITAGPVRLDLLAVIPYGPTTFPRAVQRAAEGCRLWHIGRPDLDNIEKLVCDALNKIAWRDDGQVAIVSKAKRYGSPGRIEVVISWIAQAADEKTPGQLALEKKVAREGWDAVLAGEDEIALRRRRGR